MLSLKRTALFDIYKKYGGVTVPFAGYELPVFFAAGGLREHMAVREAVGLFDVSHMGTIRFTGADREQFLEYVTPVDLSAVVSSECRYTLILNDQGGVKDDCIITKFDDCCQLVVNAECKANDITYLQNRLAVFKGDVRMEVINGTSLIALQGPKAVTALQELVKDDITVMPFMTSRYTTTHLNGHDVNVTRCGYTGEDGFEISMKDTDAMGIVTALLTGTSVAPLPAGLAARNSLRLEAGMCLYYSELTETTTPMSARLMWTVSKKRLANGGFIGHHNITEMLKDLSKYVPQVRVGLVYPTGVIAREGIVKCKTDGGTGRVVGRITSSVFSPTLKTNIAQGYLDRDVSTPGTEGLYVDVRGKHVDLQVAKLPFIKAKYYK